MKPCLSYSCPKIALPNMSRMPTSSPRLLSGCETCVTMTRGGPYGDRRAPARLDATSVAPSGLPLLQAPIPLFSVTTSSSGAALTYSALYSSNCTVTRDARSRGQPVVCSHPVLACALLHDRIVRRPDAPHFPTFSSFQSFFPSPLAWSCVIASWTVP